MDVARVVSEGLTIAIGVGFLLTSFLTGKRIAAGAPLDERQQKRRRAFLPLGLVMIAVGTSRLLWLAPSPASRVSDPGTLGWRDVTTTDGVLRMRMPGEPEFQASESDGPEGPTRFAYQYVEINGGAVAFSVRERHYLAEDIRFDREVFLNSTAEATVAQARGQLLAQRDVPLGEVVGKEIRVAVANGYAVTSRFFLVGHTVYQVSFVAPQGMLDSPHGREFFGSLRVAPAGGIGR